MIVGLLLGGPILDNRLESIAQTLTEHLQDQVPTGSGTYRIICCNKDPWTTNIRDIRLIHNSQFTRV